MNSRCFVRHLYLLATNYIFQVAQFFICESTQCIFETLPPHILAVMILVKILTYQFNGRKVRAEVSDRNGSSSWN